ncbi:hypothetical protein BD410DRAFT_449214 [Rickenella mellea]|uniref:Uncharacterized protein n=1 Tax=Rickenella mellea TaxID=50990 RepID=A0A4Y7PVJ6_9AGAM|nr:hypothetical protein BD410DRAFT_449214 [Rickenella mellea]
MPRNPFSDYDLKPGVLVPYGIIDLPFGRVELVRRKDVNSDKISYVRMPIPEPTSYNDRDRKDLMSFADHFESLGTFSVFLFYVDENFKKWVVMAVPKEDMPPDYFPPRFEKAGKGVLATAQL